MQPRGLKGNELNWLLSASTFSIKKVTRCNEKRYREHVKKELDT